MKRRELAICLTALLLIASSVGVLAYYKANQRLGKPGLKTSAIHGGDLRVKIELPASAQGLSGVLIPPSDTVTNMLPPDTSIAQMCYTNPAGLRVYCTAVLMGTDRTSIHKPQYCLRGQGFTIDEARSELTTLRVYKPDPVDLPVVKLIASRDTVIDGKPRQTSCVFVYWLVCGDEVTASRSHMGLSMSKHMLRTGELQRWSYVFYLAECVPGREDDAFKHIGRVINATLPQFQLTWPPDTARGTM
ncbi:MAG: hypothetical protein RLY20_1113 [Verrucomicrobiota bacterium]